MNCFIPAGESLQLGETAPLGECSSLPSVGGTALRPSCAVCQRVPRRSEPQLPTAVARSVMYSYWLCLHFYHLLPDPSFLPPGTNIPNKSWHPRLHLRLCFPGYVSTAACRRSPCEGVSCARHRSGHRGNTTCADFACRCRQLCARGLHSSTGRK